MVDSCFKTFRCGSAIASSSVASAWIKGRAVEEVVSIKNIESCAMGRNCSLGLGFGVNSNGKFVVLVAKHNDELNELQSQLQTQTIKYKEAKVLADIGIYAIDEFNEMDEVDCTAIHEVMEQQTQHCKSRHHNLFKYMIYGEHPRRILIFLKPYFHDLI